MDMHSEWYWQLAPVRRCFEIVSTYSPGFYEGEAGGLFWHQDKSGVHADNLFQKLKEGEGG